MIINQVILIGRVGKFKDIKYLDNGSAVATISLGVKRGEKWNNHFIKFFNTPKSLVAERIMEDVKEGEYIQIVGKLSQQTFIPKGWEGLTDESGRQKTVTQNEVIGFKYRKVYYNEEVDGFEFIDNEED